MDLPNPVKDILLAWQLAKLRKELAQLPRLSPGRAACHARALELRDDLTAQLVQGDGTSVLLVESHELFPHSSLLLVREATGHHRHVAALELWRIAECPEREQD